MSNHSHLADLTALTEAVSRYDSHCAAVEAMDAFFPGYLAQMRDLYAEQRALEKILTARAAEFADWLEEAQAIKREDEEARGGTNGHY